MVSEKIEKLCINNSLPVAREGIPIILISAAVTGVCFVASWTIAVYLFLVLTLFIIWFFRDPERPGQLVPGEVLSPADGRVVMVEELKDNNNPLEQPCIKIGVFMSIFNVHVNRIPITGTIEKIVYNSGKFFSANLDKASDENEKNCLVLMTENSRNIAFVQIAGLIARRIVCWIGEHDKVISGQRFGLIRFGSRLDIYMPMGSHVSVNKGDKVKAGESRLGFMPEENR